MSDIPAFPTTQYTNGVSPSGHDHGMTLRDYFAARAMQSLVADPDDQHNMTRAQIATWAYAMADAMLKAREAK